MRPLLPFLLMLVLITPLPPEEPPVPPGLAPARMELPPGFHALLVAGEPTLVKPMAMTLDDRGRLWVVESHSYPNWIRDGRSGHDRILIFEDRGDGHFDGKVFWDQGTNLSGIALGFGGVWLCATPNLLFIPVRPGEDKPAGPPRVVLDGWNLDGKHNVMSTLTWGPDGWLYGCHGILSTSLVGSPGTPAAERVPLNCGVWRYHPTGRRFEVFAWGTTNPWGLDFDDRGEMFITNCVISHLFHVVPGAHFERMYGQDLNPHCYGLMAGCADHLHWAGGDWTTSRGGQGAHSVAGGGHAHSGALIYQGDNWPDSYRGHLFVCNLHGSRLNQDILERRGSGYVVHHGLDFLFAHDAWFRGVSLLSGPDGGVFVSDWHDTGECHNYDQVHACGRVFKVVFGSPKPVPIDLAKLGDQELLRLQLHKNDWWVRQSRRLLQERAAAGKLERTVQPALLRMLAEQTDGNRKLRAVWALQAIGGLTETALLNLLREPGEDLRRWAVRLMVEQGTAPPAALEKLPQLARSDPAPSVRLALASALQRLPLADRMPLAGALASHGEDAGDANLPLMIWYGIEPLAGTETRAAALLAKARIPLVRQYVARRLAEEHWDSAVLTEALAPSDPALQRDVLRGVYEALQGRTGLTGSPAWTEILHHLSQSPDGEVRDKALFLSVLFGGREATAALRQRVLDSHVAQTERQAALQTLIEAKAPDLLPVLRDLLSPSAEARTEADGMRGAALRALAAIEDPGVPGLILERYASLGEAERTDAIATLTSRPAYALALLAAMERGQIPRRDLSAFAARQLLTLKDDRLAGRLTRVWGTIRPAAENKRQLLERYLGVAAPDALKKADRANGRKVFARTCGACHTLFGAGAKIGPDLTGSQRTNPEYILSKVLDPSAVVARDYQVAIVATTAGRTLTGLIKEETDKVLTLQTQNEVVRIPKADIEARQQSHQSLMPDGQLEKLSDVEVRDLIAYLAGPGQVPLK
jgi:putative membrane-bound dehydrogenase-like protein